MSIWTRLANIAHTLFAPVTDVPDSGSTAMARVPNSKYDVRSGCGREIMPADASCGPDPGDVSFTAAIVGLGAKLAKADGLVTEDEVEMFSRVFRAAPEDQDSVRRVFNLARQTVRGYEAYAKQIARRYGDRPCLLEGILDGLFQIALADNIMTLHELEYLKSVSEAFGFSDDDFRRIQAAHMGTDKDDPYQVLGLPHGADYDEVRRTYRQLMMDHHPDRIVATKKASDDYEGVAHEKAAAITSAFARIRAERGILISPN
ncbi:TerB family tellurite resistance protein [Hirschia litorea]|uniref:TerB family tellurite resistance protein n=1 Tax=Hirschia litorea TaxID=1199156 RepID=A0ABW2IM56_9PROT